MEVIQHNIQLCKCSNDIMYIFYHQIYQLTFPQEQITLKLNDLKQQILIISLSGWIGILSGQSHYAWDPSWDRQDRSDLSLVLSSRKLAHSSLQKDSQQKENQTQLEDFLRPNSDLMQCYLRCFILTKSSHRPVCFQGITKQILPLRATTENLQPFVVYHREINIHIFSLSFSPPLSLENSTTYRFLFLAAPIACKVPRPGIELSTTAVAKPDP